LRLIFAAKRGSEGWGAYASEITNASILCPIRVTAAKSSSG